jgi:hypothetical protein
MIFFSGPSLPGRHLAQDSIGHMGTEHAATAQSPLSPASHTLLGLMLSWLGSECTLGTWTPSVGLHAGHLKVHQLIQPTVRQENCLLQTRSVLGI